MHIGNIDNVYSLLKFSDLSGRHLDALHFTLSILPDLWVAVEYQLSVN